MENDTKIVLILDYGCREDMRSTRSQKPSFFISPSLPFDSYCWAQDICVTFSLL